MNMFNWELFIFLILACIPGIWLILPVSKNIYKIIKSDKSKNKKIPSENLFLFVSVLQSLMLVTLAAFIGTKVLHSTHFSISICNFTKYIIPITTINLGGIVIFLFSYYFLFRPNLDLKTIRSMEQLRLDTGIFGRIFYGGIVEEVIFRWGLMSFISWIGISLFGYSNTVIWISILLSGLCFAIGHLPAYLAFGCIKSNTFITMVIVLNIWAATIFGWLFWHYGLYAAIFSHALFHLTWYPIDLAVNCGKGKLLYD